MKGPFLKTTYIILLSIFATDSFAQTYIQFYGRSLTNDPISFTGHSFIIISHHLNSGIKEEGYGFYPSSNPILSKGDLKYELKDLTANDYKYLGKAKKYLEKELSGNDLNAVFKIINDQKKLYYSLSNENCVSFVNKIAEALKLNTPLPFNSDPSSAKSIAFPSDYLYFLAKINPVYATIEKTTKPKSSTKPKNNSSDSNNDFTACLQPSKNKSGYWVLQNTCSVPVKAWWAYKYKSKKSGRERYSAFIYTIKPGMNEITIIKNIPLYYYGHKNNQDNITEELLIKQNKIKVAY